MTADLTRSEQHAFLEGIGWVAAHLYEAARRVRDDKRGMIEVEGKPSVEAIIKPGDPAFAEQLTELADSIMQGGLEEAVRRYPKFDPLPKAAKGGQTSGF